MIKKISIRLPLILVCVLCFHISSFAQSTAAKSQPVVTLAKMDAGSSSQPVMTVAQILAEPKLKCNQPNCEIIGFQVSTLSKNTGADSAKEKMKYSTPISCTGANLPARIIDLLNGFTGREGKLFIENIYVMYKNEKIHVKPVILKIIR